jgi:hypothetical protein
MIIIGIDPGPEKSGYVELDTETALVTNACHDYNYEIRQRLSEYMDEHILVQEMPASYGMAVGATIMETCVQLGRFEECCVFGYTRLYRKTIATILCGQAKAKGPYIRQCIIDMYGAGAIGGKKCTRCKGKGWFGAGRPPCTKCRTLGTPLLSH